MFWLAVSAPYCHEVPVQWHRRKLGKIKKKEAEPKSLVACTWRERNGAIVKGATEEAPIWARDSA